VRVGKEYGINPTHLMLERLVAKIGPRIDEDNATVIEGQARGGSVTMISRVVGCAYLTRAPGEGNSR